MPDPAAVVESANSLFAHFSPAKSPYYTIGLASCIALFYSCDVGDRGKWLWVATPIFLVSLLTLLLSIASKNDLSESEHAEQLRFARSTCISVAVLSLAFGARDIWQALTTHVAGPPPSSVPNPSYPYNFTITIWICCIQIAVFLVLCYGLNRQDLGKTDRNYVQIALLTSAFLGDTCLNLAYATHSDSDSGAAQFHQYTAYTLGGLWLFCVVFWFVMLIKLQIIVIRTYHSARTS